MRAALDAWRIRYLGRKGGALSEAMKRLAVLSREERPAYGQAANEVKERLEAAFGEREEALTSASLRAELTAGAVDVTLPGRRPELGHLHVVTQTLRQIVAIFGEMGFQVYEAPDVETDELQLRPAQHAALPSGARHVGYLLGQPGRRGPSS